MSQFERETARETGERQARKRFLGMLLMAMGGLIALLCGLCTLWVSVAFITAPSASSPADYSILLFPLFLGGLPAAAGAAVFWRGRRMYQEGRSPGKQSGRVFD